jgi:arsenite methyltransferase
MRWFGWGHAPPPAGGHHVLMPRPDAATALRDAVRDAYSAIAYRPEGDHPISVGRRLAEGIGYPAALLDSLPQEAVEAFAGVSYPGGFAEIPPGSLVLDLGCGAGLDSLTTASSAGTVIGVDFSERMLRRARTAAKRAGVRNVDFRKADAKAIPVADRAVDVALGNGIFNLSTDRASVFQELARVVRPGGRAYVSELILREPLPPGVEASSADWFA